ncbi:MAG: hypothetical protein ACOX0T_00405 [Pelotomaculum sp.]
MKRSNKRVDPKTTEVGALEKKIKKLDAANDILKSAFFCSEPKRDNQSRSNYRLAII